MRRNHKIAPTNERNAPKEIAGQNRYDELVSIYRQNVANRIVALPGGVDIINMNCGEATAWVTGHADDIVALIKNQEGL